MESLDKAFPIVGIGASAGGLEAVSELIEEIPAATGIAYLLVQHLDPHRQSFLTEILSKKAAIPVETAADGTVVERDHFYVIPPNSTLTVADGVLRLVPRESGERPPKPINALFRSLAEQHHHRAVAIVLSGADSDGAEGLEEVKAAGGITMAQEPASARFDNMPRSAIATGCVDLILPPNKLGKEMLRIGRHPYLSSEVPPDGLVQEEDVLRRVFRLLQDRTGTDFSRYKRTTVQRRLARRMALRQVERLAQYADLLGQEPAEVHALAQDFLIRVTGFFRDPETFESLKETVFPTLMEGRAAQSPLRIWVPGCASGEEVYSIAIVLLEYIAGHGTGVRIQIFGTDLSEAAIEKARIGSYSDSIADEISSERLERFFVKVDKSYQVSKEVRDVCVFARHDVTRDPPFSRLDLVSCRNLLIYLDPALQRRIIELFHYSLNPNGFLIVGSSETVAGSQFFRMERGGRPIYRRQPAPAPVVPSFTDGGTPPRAHLTEIMTAASSARTETERALKEAERLLLVRYAPACILVDDNLNVLYFHGETSRYLEHARGAASLNLEKICRAGLLVELSPAVREAQKTQRPVVREGVRVELPGEEGAVSFEVIPVTVPGIAALYSLVLFGHPVGERSEPRPADLLMRLWTTMFGASSRAEADKDIEIARLQRELAATRDYLKATVEEQEAAKEEMRSAHEEALSSNEEFLSTNEELETAKEELQSANEELAVANQELRNRNAELNALNDELRRSRSYLDAIVETLRQPLLVLDGELRVQKGNHEFYQTFRVTPQDILNQHLYDLGNGQWNIPALRRLLEGVLPEDTTLRDFEVVHEFPDIGRKTMLLNARRLVGAAGRGDMILLAIEDVTERRLSQTKLLEADQRKNNFLATLAHELRNPLAPIRIGIELLRHDTPEADVRHLDMMERQIQKLVRLVDGLLDIARIARDHIELKKVPFDLVELLNHAIEDSRSEFDQRRHTVLSHLPSEPIRIMGDPLRIEQVVLNLLGNAAKYTDPGGEIVVALERRGDEAAITVRDNGIGIAPELMPQLFELFFQVDSSLDRAGGGLGIGLNVAKRLVELHGGRIAAYSKGLGRGSEFTVHLPVTSEAENHPEPLSKKITESVPAVPVSHRVLIVDDNPDMASATAELAMLCGHEVATARDGSSALELASTFRPDIALIDIGLPRMDGYELARRLRKLPAMEGVLLVAMTGYAREQDRLASREAGFALHLVKPVEPDRLETLLATLH